MQRNIKCLCVKENSLPEEIIIPNTLKAKQEIVGGYIEYVYLNNEDDVAIICNEEGKLNGMGPNRDIGYDILFGPFLIVGETDNDGEDRSLTEEQINKYKEYFNEDSISKTYEKLEKIISNRNDDLNL